MASKLPKGASNEELAAFLEQEQAESRARLAAMPADLPAPPPNGAKPARARQAARQTVDWRVLFRPVADIIAETDDEIDWLVQGLIPRGWLGMVVADTKVGKTLLMLQLARALGMGEDFLGMKCSQGTTMLALVDDPKALTKKRLKETLTDVPGVRAYIDRWNTDALVGLEAAVKEEPPDLVVVDTLVKTTPAYPGAENDPAAMDRLMERFAVLTGNEKTTVILLHHENAAGNTRGTTAIPCAAPLVIKLKTDAKENERSRQITLSMHWKLEPIDDLALIHEEGRFAALGTTSEVRRGDLENRVLAAVAQGYDRQTTIQEHLRSQRQQTLDALNSLVQKGLLSRSGTGGKGSPFTYALTPSGA